MVSQQLMAVFTGFAVLFSAISWLYAYRCWLFCQDTEEFIKLQNKRSVTLAKLAEIEAQMTDLTDAYDAILASHKKLRARIGMRAVRAEKENAVPDAATDPAGYKRAMRLQLQQR